MLKQYGRPILVILIIQVLVMVGFGIIIPIIPFLIGKLGGGPSLLGIFMSAYSIMQFFFAPLWGRLSDRIGRRPVLLIGLSGYAITFVMFGLANNLWLLIGIRALSGIISSATLPTAMAYLADITEGDDRSKSMGMVGAAMGMGMIFGPALGGWLGHYSFSLPFFVAGGLAFLVLPFAFAYLPETLKQPVASGQGKVVRINLDVIHNPLFFLFVFYFVMYFATAIFEGTFSLLAKDRVGFGPKQMGTAFTILGTIGVIVQGFLLGKLVKIFGDARMAKFGAWASGIAFLLIVWSNNQVTLMASTAVFMVGNSLMGPTCSSLATRISTEGQGASMGLLQSFGSLGRILGPLAGGVLYEYNMNLPYLIGAVLLIIIVLIGNQKMLTYEKLSAGAE